MPQSSNFSEHWSVMSRLRGIPLVLGAVFLCFITLAIAHAQVTTADLVGTVTDSSGAAVVHGSASVLSLGTGATQKTPLSASGDYQFTLLQVGTYKVTIQAQGFKTFVTQVTLAAGDRARVNALLTVGQTSETVTVEATAPALQSQDATVGTLITGDLTQNLPLDGRNVTNLVQLSAGVTVGLPDAMNSGTRGDDRRQTSSFAANGQSDEVNNNMIDGMDDNERFIGTVGVKPSIDAIQEVDVYTNLYSAEITRSGGGVVDIITKSGTNQFHGTLYEFLRNDILDARGYFQGGIPKPELRQNQFGGSIGGPIKKDKAFFFFDYEDFRNVLGVTALDTVPTLYEEQHPGDFTDLGASCTNVSSQVSTTSIGYYLFKLYPAPNAAGQTQSNCAPTINNYNFSAGETQFAGTYDAKVDYHFSDKNLLYGRFTYNNVASYIPGLMPSATVDGITVNPGGGEYGAAGGNSFAGPAADVELNGALGFTHIISPTLILELKAQYLQVNNQSKTVNEGVDVGTDFGFPCNATYCTNVPGIIASSGLPDIVPATYTGMGDAAYIPLQDLDNVFQYMIDLSWIKGTQSVKAGASVIRRHMIAAQSAYPRGVFNLYGNKTGNELGDMLLDYAALASRNNNLIAAGFRMWELGYFVQDNWRLNPKLTLNLGVRYDVFTPFTSSNYGFANLDNANGLLIGPGLPGTQQSGPTAGVLTDRGDIAPRLGIDYSVTPTLVVRGGYGLSYYPGNQTSGSVMRNAPYNYSWQCGASPYSNVPCTGANAEPDGGFYMAGGTPRPFESMALATNPLNYYGTEIDSTDPNYKSPFLQQYSLNVEKDFRGNVVTLAYVGNHGNRLVLADTNVNQLPYPVADGGTYPFANIWPQTTASGALLASGVTVVERESNLRSGYNAFQATVGRRIRNGLAANVNYTFSHNLTNAMVVDEGQNVGDCVGQCWVDNGSGGVAIYNSYYQYDYGNADLDVRQRFALTMTYNLPFGKNVTGPADVVKGWTVNAIYFAQGGNPFTVLNSSGSQSEIGLANDRPNMTGKMDYPKKIGEWFDISKFALQGAGLQGNEQRNQVYGPGTQALNFSLFKTFPIWENANLEFRAESFNLLNTPTFAAPGSTVTEYSAGGVATSAAGFGVINSQPVSAPQREFQFALKLIF